MSWSKMEIGKLVSLKQGFAINKNTKHHMSDEQTNLHLLRIGDMKDNNFSVYVKDTIPANFIAEYDDIIYTRTGQVGLVFTNQRGVVHNNCFTVTPIDETILNRKFLYYVLQTKEFYEEANSRASGAAQPDLPHAAFNSIKILLPDIEVQKRIADILSTYDNLIENNQKQIKLLEEAAQRLYKEWFVDLRFPGYENTKIVDGVPEGWKKIFLSEIIEYEIGGGWGEEQPTEKCDKLAYVIRGTDLYGIMHGDILSIPCRYHARTNLDGRKLEDGDIIFEVSGGSKNEGVARTVLIKAPLLEYLGKPVMCASFCKLIRLKEKQYSNYLFDSFQYMRASGKTLEYDKKSASSIVNYRWKDFLEQESILIPDEESVAKYNSIAGNIYNLIMNNSIGIEIAKQMRDYLLPKLMNGEIEV